MSIAGLVDTSTGAAVDPETRYEPARTAASQAEMEAGTESALRSMSPLRVAQAIAALAAGGAWDGDIADINLDGGTDIGEALAWTDLVLVDHGANGTNRKSALTRLQTLINTGISPLLSGYTVQGDTSLASSSGALTVPLDGKYYAATLTENTTVAFSGAPTAPVCGGCVLVLTQAASGGPYTVSWPSSGVVWANGMIQPMPATASAVMVVYVATGPTGAKYISAQWFEAGS